MSIEEMTFVSIIGKLSCLEDFILKIIEFNMFHIENPRKNSKIEDFVSLSNEKNPYEETYKKIYETAKILNIPINFNYNNNLSFKKDDAIKKDFVYEIYNKVYENEKEIDRLKVNILNIKSSLMLIEHMKNLNISIKDIFKSNNIKAHFGTIPIDNISKLDYIKNENFYFLPQDKDDRFCWGIIISTKTCYKKAMEFFNGIYFEEHIIKDDIMTIPKIAIEEMKDKIKKIEDIIKILETRKKEYKEKYSEAIELEYIKFKILYDSFNYRKFAVANKDKFVIEGFIPTSKIDYFNKMFKNEKGIVFEFAEKDEIEKSSFPVKLKTSPLFRPFEMYIKTYGIPKYGTINPSSFVGLIYSLIFGVMFGDVGQGALVFIFGFFIWKFKKNNLGLILTRCGFSSIIFGFIFDSIFGFEGILKYFWKAVLPNSEFFPFYLLKPKNSLSILIISAIIGILLIIISMIFNIYLNIKNKDIKKAIISQNGLAGFICYGSCALGVIFLIFVKKNIFSPTFIVCLIVLPLMLIFFATPIENKLNFKSKKIKTKKEKFTVSSAIFEMIDIILSYFTNTLSFLRIGGLCLSHAALMLVVMKFGTIVGDLAFFGVFAKPIIIIVGNLFVVLLEGLIVSIQALRLIYYEIFSRFYEANGKPFMPVKINFEK